MKHPARRLRNVPCTPWQAAVAVALTLWTGVGAADSPRQPTPSAQAVGAADEFLFVMLPGNCAELRREVLMSREAYEALAAASRDATPAPEARGRGDDDSDCASAETPGGASFTDQAARVTMRRERWTVTASMHSRDGEPFPASGLYRNDGSATPLWTVEWYGGDVRVSDDGRYLVRFGPWASSPTQVAVAFYDRGRLVRRYRIDELVGDPGELPRSVWHFRWRASAGFDAARRLLKVSTLDGLAYLFDAGSGETLAAYSTRQVVDASLERLDGDSLVVDDLHACWSDTVLIGSRVDDTSSPATGSVAAVSLGETERMSRLDDGGETGARFRVTLRGGEERTVEFAAPAPSLCGVAGGHSIVVPLDVVRTLAPQH